MCVQSALTIVAVSLVVSAAVVVCCCPKRALHKRLSIKFLGLLLFLVLRFSVVPILTGFPRSLLLVQVVVVRFSFVLSGCTTTTDRSYQPYLVVFFALL